VAALSAEWSVDTLSWLPDVDRWGPRRWVSNPLHLLRALGLSLLLPAQVAYVQGRAPKSLRRAGEGHAVVVFVTNRAVPRRLPAVAVVDFVDDLGEIARKRAQAEPGPMALFWRWEATRVARLDRRLARSATASVAHSGADAAGIGPGVRAVPLSVGTRAGGPEGHKVVFIGNLFYAPNHEAALWICDELVPELSRRGIGPHAVVIAGRRPKPPLRKAAEAVGVELRADVAEVSEVLDEAAVVVVPTQLGTGAQYKVLDAVGAGRPCVLSPVANRGLGLVDGRSALVAERDAVSFARSVTRLLGDPDLGRRLAGEARSQLGPYFPEAVAESWREVLRDVMGEGRR